MFILFLLYSIFACHSPQIHDTARFLSDSDALDECLIQELSFTKSDIIQTPDRHFDSQYHNEGPNIAVLDLDHNDHPDIIQCFPMEPGYLINEHGWHPTPLLLTCGAMAVLDIDKDGWDDLIVESAESLASRGKGLQIYQNQNGELIFQRSIVLDGQVHAIRVADFNQDQELDLFLAFLGNDESQSDRNRIFLGNGHFDFMPQPLNDNILDGKTFDVGIGDFNKDGWPDVFVANDRGYEYGGDLLLWNRHGVLELDDCNCFPVQSAMGADIGDFNKDGLLDIVTGDVVQTHVLQNFGDESFVDVTMSISANQMESQEMSWGLRLIDLNNDGQMDLFSAQGDHTYAGLENPEYEGDLPLSLLMQDEGAFRDLTTRFGFTDTGSFRSIVPLHWNEDGILDYWITDVQHGGQLWLSNGCSDENWLNFKGPIGTAIRFRSNNQELYGELNNSSSYGASISAHWHIGLGRITEIEQVEIRYPGQNWEFFAPFLSSNQEIRLGLVDN